MAKASPQTTYNGLTEQINELLRDNGHFLSASSIQVCKLKSQCDKLVKTNAAEGWITYARIAQLCGDEEEFRRCIQNASRLDSSNDWKRTKAVGLTNFGYFSEASLIFSELVDPKIGGFSEIYLGALCSGAIQRVLECYEVLPSMGINVPPDFPAEIVRNVASFMQTTNINDQTIARFLDLAGEVLRNHDCMHAVSGPVAQLTEIDTKEVLHMRFALNLEASEIADANLDLANLVAETQVELPENVHVSFGSNK